jgi:hypothetical protein
MEYTRTSEFPHYEDGDVAVIIAPVKTYQLHSGVLRRYSHYFSEVLGEDQAANLSSKAKKDGVTTRYRLQLVRFQAGAIGTFHRLVSAQRPPRYNFPLSNSLVLPAHRQLWSLTIKWLFNEWN